MDEIELLMRLAQAGAADGPHGHPLSPPAFVIDAQDVGQIFEGQRSGLIWFAPTMAKFNTVDRPIEGGHWSLLSFYKRMTILNGEYLPQLACYVDMIRRLGFHEHRVLFEPGDRLSRVDHAVLGDDGRVVIVGEAKVDPRQPDDLLERILARYALGPPGDAPTSKNREGEARKLAAALWAIRPPYLWLVAPGVRRAYACTYAPVLTIDPLSDLPSAPDLGLTTVPPTMMSVPDYTRAG